jgi:hypothetical protein
MRRLLPALLLLATAGVAQKTILVPANQPTIQAAILAASNGDTVLVSPGTYHENINFSKKAITVQSSGGPAVTIIDGGKAGSVVTFNQGEELTSVLQGFAIQNGSAQGAIATGGGISPRSIRRRRRSFRI